MGLDNKEKSEEEVEYDSLVDFIWMFCMTTTVKGIGRALKSQSVFLKLLWYLATLTGAGTALYFVIDTLVEYHSHEVNASFGETTDFDFHFPDVTFCKNNGIGDLENVEGIVKISEYFEALQKNRHYFTRESIKALTNMTVIGTNVEETVWDSVASVTGYLENITPYQDQQISNNSRFIQSCRAVDWAWSELEVPWEQAITFIPTVSHSVCATLSLPEHLARRTRGLSILLYLGDTDIIPIPTSSLHPLHSRSTGAACVTHERNTMPDMKQSMFLGPGTESNINLFPTLYTRLPTKTEMCLDKKSSWKPYKFPSSYSYSEEECKLMCKAETIVNKCDCFDASLLANRWMQTDNCGAVRDFSNITRDDIIELIETQVCLLTSHKTRNRKHCQCPVRCEEYLYHPEITQTPWPHPALLRAFIESNWSVPDHHKNYFSNYDIILEEERRGLLGADETSRALQQVGVIEKNFLQVNIKFPLEKLNTMTARYKTTAASLMALIGGNLNLWIGVTFFTLVEILELVFYSIIYCSNKNLLIRRKTNLHKADYDETGEKNQNVYCIRYKQNSMM